MHSGQYLKNTREGTHRSPTLSSPSAEGAQAASFGCTDPLSQPKPEEVNPPDTTYIGKINLPKHPAGLGGGHRPAPPGSISLWHETCATPAKRPESVQGQCRQHLTSHPPGATWSHFAWGGRWVSFLSRACRDGRVKLLHESIRRGKQGMGLRPKGKRQQW